MSTHIPTCRAEMKIRQLTTANLSAADQLRSDAGWNQTKSDWLRLLAFEPQGCFAALWNQSLVGTVTTTCYGIDLAWIGMVLVNPAYRGQGIGSALMNRALANLQKAGVNCIQLDATPAGKSVYQKLGFRELSTFHRWIREASTPSKTKSSSQFGFQWTSLLAELDRRAFGADRADWLRLLEAESVTICQEEGLAMRRAGAKATYLGPVTTAGPAIAKQCIESLLDDVPGPVIWDVPGLNPAAKALATSLGFQPQRELTRMAIGTLLPEPEPLLQFALADLATG